MNTNTKTVSDWRNLGLDAKSLVVGVKDLMTRFGPLTGNRYSLGHNLGMMVAKMLDAHNYKPETEMIYQLSLVHAKAHEMMVADEFRSGFLSGLKEVMGMMSLVINRPDVYYRDPVAFVYKYGDFKPAKPEPEPEPEPELGGPVTVDKPAEEDRDRARGY